MPEYRRPDAKAIQVERLAIVTSRNATLAATQKPWPVGFDFKTMVVDFPWPMQKIKRDCRPNQVGFDYPTMSLAEIVAVPLWKIVDLSGAHLFVWTTQKFIQPLFRELLPAWEVEFKRHHADVRYSYTFVWPKSGGPQPVGGPQFTEEFCIYLRCGKIGFTQTKNFRTRFEGPRRGHSVKPIEAYATIARVCEGPRLDMFARQDRPGWSTFGNEVAPIPGLGPRWCTICKDAHFASSSCPGPRRDSDGEWL